MRVLSANDLRKALPMSAAIDAMREAFIALSRDEVEMPLRSRLNTPDGIVLAMPAYADGISSLKVVSVYSGNNARGMPAIQAVVLSIFVARGPNILEFFHVSIFALEVAGGLILLLFAIGLVLGEGHDSSETAHRAGSEMAIYPLAVPLLASPQAIVAITIFSTQMGVGNRQLLWAGLATIIAGNLAVMLGVAQVIGGDKKKGGGGFAQVLLRIVALLLAALAVEIMVLGLRGFGVLPPMPAAAH